MLGPSSSRLLSRLLSTLNINRSHADEITVSINYVPVRQEQDALALRIDNNSAHRSLAKVVYSPAKGEVTMLTR